VKTRRKSIPGPYEGLMLEEENKVRKNWGMQCFGREGFQAN
jgi:hypothetical protein